MSRLPGSVAKRTSLMIALSIGALGLFASPGAWAAIRVQIVMLSGGSSSDGQLDNDVATRLIKLGSSRFTLSNFSGRIYFSYGAPVTNAEPPRWPTRYDKVELTYPGVANLTAVDFFGIPFRLQTLDARGKPLGTLAWNAPTDTVEKALLAIPRASRALVRTRNGGFARILSPQLSPSSYPSLNPYVRSIRGLRLTVSGSFFGNPFQTFGYSGSFAGDGRTTLTGTITPKGGAKATGEALGVAGATLPSAVYTVDGPYTWGGSTHMVSDNDVYAVIYRDLIAGFAWGYWGGRYGNDSARWQDRPPFEAARRHKTKYATYNEYAAVVYKYSNAYGFSFSDTGPKKVQLPLGGAATLRITILPDRAKR
jgi:hypothetical protein